ncbi:FkbM family methyltransferase [Jannaschia sp. CCS1]|uniref:FkbM family methyltransferase n=1 Tax=Jannaschia sp. (strain CCS1) TaxID=290400 RepID=UPI000053CD79|nr:FkbM family methyltransferase [Jannaschia sp. CCS1]ABD55280.1 Methyltransferase FkbM [Jannaschia sp. CCS1]
MADLTDLERTRHLVDLLAPARKTRIVDIGANPINDNPYAPLLDIGAAEVWGFEPQTEAFDKLVARNAPDEHYVNAAVGKGGTGTLNICASSGTSSLLTPNVDAMDAVTGWHKYFEVVGTVDVETKRLDNIAEIPEFDLLKIDVQGAEREVFTYGKKRLSTALAVITEVAAIPLYEDQPLLGDQMVLLGKLGFDLHKFLFWKDVVLRSKYLNGMRRRRMRTQLVDGDAVFVRDLLHLKDMETERLKHLTLLADAVFESFDMVLYCLEILEDRGVLTEAAIRTYVARMPYQRDPQPRLVESVGQ